MVTMRRNKGTILNDDKCEPSNLATVSHMGLNKCNAQIWHERELFDLEKIRDVSRLDVLR